MLSRAESGERSPRGQRKEAEVDHVSPCRLMVKALAFMLRKMACINRVVSRGVT